MAASSIALCPPSPTEAARVRAIRQVLRSARIPTRAGTHFLGPQAAVYHMEPPPELMARALTQGEAIGAALGAPAVRLSRSGAWLAVEVPSTDRGLVLMSDHGPALAMTLRGELLRPRLDDASPHVLIAGQTGCGKTETLRSLALLEAADHRRRMVLLDLEGQTWQPFAGHGYTIIDTAAGAADALAWCVDQMAEGSEVAGGLVVAIDEASMLSRGALQLARVIAERGRKWGVHLVLATQHPRADIIDMCLKTNLTTKIIGRCWAKAEQVVEMAGARFLRGRGDVLISGPELQPTRAQVAMADGPVWRYLPRALPVDIPAAGDAPVAQVHPGHALRLDWDAMIQWAIDNPGRDGEPASSYAIRRQFRCGQPQASEARDRARERSAALPPCPPSIIRPDFAALAAAQ